MLKKILAFVAIAYAAGATPSPVEAELETIKTALAARLGSSKPSNAQLLELYALYRQATCGDRPADFATTKPMDMKERMKHAQWTKKAGMSSEEAVAAYRALAESIGK